MPGKAKLFMRFPFGEVIHAKGKTNFGNVKIVPLSRAGKKNFLHGSITWKQKFPADQRSIFVLNLHAHKYIVL